jgi:hypothetical protein
MPLPARILAALFAIASVFAFVAIPVAWSLLGTESDAGNIPRDLELRGRLAYLAVGCVLGLIYGGAAWFIWTGKNWSVAMLLSVCACFGFPIGTALSIAAIVILLLRNVRAAFRIRRGEPEN